MAKNLADLAHDMDKLAATLRMEGSRCAVSVARAIEVELAQTTPIDTGAAISNWQGSLDSPVTSEIEPHIPGRKGSTQIANIKGTIGAFDIEIENKKPGQTIYIANNVDYIRKLNDGTSSQALPGFIERAILVGKLSIKKFKMKLEL